MANTKKNATAPATAPAPAEIQIHYNPVYLITAPTSDCRAYCLYINVPLNKDDKEMAKLAGFSEKKSLGLWKSYEAKCVIDAFAKYLRSRGRERAADLETMLHLRDAYATKATREAEKKLLHAAAVAQAAADERAAAKVAPIGKKTEKAEAGGFEYI